ncbi:hypothetical protein [Kocuria sp. UCD-OTCP]|uniref:hypothetical protein n=1 Tax=Kocuria sp. UCD-OTCP TaxID=1292021 RepID=UPI0004259F2D|nr:hypothetical protein [Kocuria sp. UCD-OTCP]
MTSYNDALTPIYLWIMPLGLLAAAVLCFVAEEPLATTIEQDVEPEALAEGRFVVTADEPAAPRVDDEDRDADDDARDARDPREDPAALEPAAAAR